MLSLLLTICLLGDYNSNTNKAPDNVVNLTFNMAVEEFAQRSYGPLQRWEYIFNQDDADLMSMIGCGHFPSRRHARKEIEKRGFGAARITLWGMNAKDPETRMWFSENLKRLYKCGNCDGEGTKIEPKGGYRFRCVDCGGSGTYFFNRKNDYDNGGYLFPHRDLRVGRGEELP